MKSLRTVSLLMFLLSCVLNANAELKVEWSKSLNSGRPPVSKEGRMDVSKRTQYWTEGVIGDPKGGYLLFGSYRDTASGGWTAAIKVSDAGEIEWFADTMRMRPEAYGKSPKRGMNAICLSTGGYVVTGTYEMKGGYWVAGLSDKGKVLWDTSYALEGFSVSLIENSRGEIVTANDTATGLRIRRYTPAGNVIWSKRYSLYVSPFEWCPVLCEVDGKLSLVCTDAGAPKVFQLDKKGDSLTCHDIPIRTGGWELAFSRCQNSDVVLAMSDDNSKPYDNMVRIKRYDLSGELILDLRHSASQLGSFDVKGIFECPDQNVVTYGKLSNRGGGYFLMKFNQKGDTLWSARAESTLGDDAFTKAARGGDGGFLIVGSDRMSYRTWMVKIGPEPESRPEPVRHKGIFKRWFGWF